MVLAYKVGERAPGWTRVSPNPTGAQFSYSGQSGASLLIQIPHPTHMEVFAARQSQFMFGLVPAGKHTSFFLLKAQHLFHDWADAPFSWGVMPPAERHLMARLPDHGLLLSVLMINSANGIVEAIRSITLSPTFSAALEAEIRRQEACLDEWTAFLHKRELVDAYRKYASPSAMARDSIITEIGGLPFK